MPLRGELRIAQQSPFTPRTTLDIDLYAERALMLLMTRAAAPPGHAAVEATAGHGSDAPANASAGLKPFRRLAFRPTSR